MAGNHILPLCHDGEVTTRRPIRLEPDGFPRFAGFVRNAGWFAGLLAVVAVATALLLWQARRAGIARTVPVTVGARP